MIPPRKKKLKDMIEERKKNVLEIMAAYRTTNAAYQSLMQNIVEISSKLEKLELERVELANEISAIREREKSLFDSIKSEDGDDASFKAELDELVKSLMQNG